MSITDVESLKEKRKKRVGQGHGSGRGKTAGRGMKGQKARNSVPLDFEGGALPLTKRLPFLRGKGKNKPFKEKPCIINVEALNVLPKNSTVDLETLIKFNLVEKGRDVKILAEGELQVPLTVTVKTSKGAAEKIKNAGGSTV